MNGYPFFPLAPLYATKSALLSLREPLFSRQMRISEVSAEIHSAPPEIHSLLLEELESSIKEAENTSPANLSSEKLSGKLQNTLCRLNSSIPLPESVKLQIWKLSYRLWNACVDLSNAAGFRSKENSSLCWKIDDGQAKLRQIAADLLSTAGNVAGIPSPAFKSASFYYKTGLIWHDLKKFDVAASCYDRATDLMAKIDIELVSDAEERRFLLDLNLARSRTAWELSERNVALASLSRSRNLLFGNPESYKSLAEQYLQFGKMILSKDQRSAINEARKLIDEAVDLCEKSLAGGTIRQPEEAVDLKNLRSKSLRFLAAAHLQMDDFESVLKCVRVLREVKSEEHPSVAVLAMKAWLGLGRYGEAEMELRGMVVNKGVPEAICVSAVEAFFEGAGVAGAEVAKAVFLALLGRCHVSAGAAVRVAQRVVAGSGGEESIVRAKVVAELVSDERVVALFAGGRKAEVAKERVAMHALLWNCGAEHFRSKDYKTGAEMFEKSMLYVPYDIENRTLRAKCFRVLCLCHLALSQLDRAEECINEAQKLEPSIACAFLKFKIHLQKNDEGAAVNQMQAMENCLDFNLEYLTLSAHEAVACHALPVAVASLLTLLNLYTPGKPMPMPEVAVLRNIITLLFQIPDNQAEVLKFIKRARSRMSELGNEQFFGNASVGSRELNWFAGKSWNMGIITAREQQYGFCAEFFELASEFYIAMGDDEIDAGNRAMACKSFILSVAGMINAEKQSNGLLTDSDVKKGVEMLDRAGKILLSISNANHPPCEKWTVEPGFYFLHTLNAYDLYSRLSNKFQQLHLIKSYASSKACTPQHLLQVALAVSQSPCSNPEAAELALNACLTTFLASPFPDYHMIALVVRKLIVLKGFRNGDVDNEVYAAYRQAYRIMVGLKNGEYPAEEGKWLATTAWNRSVLPARLGRVDSARQWMKMGLELSRCMPGMDGYKVSMEQCLAGIEKLGNGGGDGQEEEAESRH